MKLLILFCLLGFSAADLLQHAETPIDQTVLSFFQGATKAGSLCDAFGFYDSEIEEMADDLETNLGHKIKKTFREILEKIKNDVDNGKSVAEELMKQVKELREKIKNMGGDAGEKAKEILKEIRKKAKEVLKKIIEKIGLGHRNMDDNMDFVARMPFKHIFEKIKAKILADENIQHIREYLRNVYGNTKLVKKLKELVENLSNSEIREILEHLFENLSGHNRAVRKNDTWEKVKKFFKDLDIAVQEQSLRFAKWVKDMWGNGTDQLKKKYGVVKAIAMEFIEHSKEMNAEMSREALEFFRPHKLELGGMWDKIVDVANESIGKFE